MCSPSRDRLIAILIIGIAILVFERQLNEASNEAVTSAAWIGLGVALSIAFRAVRGKPIVPKLPPHALYGEEQASGGMASRSLIVAVTADALIVMPRFPFNLLFLPEIWGMEYDLPIGSVVEVRAKNERFGANVQVLYGERREALGLKLLDPGAFIHAVLRAQSAFKPLSTSIAEP